MSSTTLALEISLLLNVCGAERFIPSLFPRWLYDTIDVGLIPAPTKKSTSTLFILVCPDLKSSPPTRTPFSTASWSRPGTKVFCGEPLMKGQPSKTEAAAYSCEGATSEWFSLTAFRKFSGVSLTPSMISA